MNGSNKKLLDFYAVWCLPCKQMNPTIEYLKREFSDIVEKIDIDKDDERVQQYGVMSVPTYIILDNDKEVARFIGVTSKDKLIGALRE